MTETKEQVLERREKARIHYAENQVTMSARNRLYYANHKEQASKYRKKSRAKQGVKAKKAFVEWKKENPESYRAWAIAKRWVPLKPNCEICGSTENLERHHKDYGKPLEVLTLCRICHNALEVIEPSICTQQIDIRYYKGGEPVEVLEHPRIKLGEKWKCRILSTGEIKEIGVGSLCYLPHKIKKGNKST
jgi:hypothetical protein